MDPRRTLVRPVGRAVGTCRSTSARDIALANAVAREILAAGLENRSFIETRDQRLRGVPPRTSSPGRSSAPRRVTGVPAALIRELAHAYARADRAVICWTLGITEHHNAVDNVLALINLAPAHRPRRALRLRRQSPARAEQRAGRRRHGRAARPAARLPARRERRAAREVRARLGRADPAQARLAPLRHVRGHGARRADGPLRHRREPGQLRGGPAPRHRSCCEGLEILVVQDMFLTATAELADVVLPAAAGWCESEGTVTNSERRVQRVRRALPPPPGVRDDIEILCELARRMGRDLGNPTAEELWNELRTLSPGPRRHVLRAAGGDAAACSGRATTSRIPARCTCTAGCGSGRSSGRGRRSAVVEHEPPVDELDDGVPAPPDHRPAAGLLQHRRADRRATPRRLRPRRDARSLPRGRPAPGRRRGGDRCAWSRGAARCWRPARFDAGLRPGLAFMTLPLPRPGGDQRADHRRRRSAVRHLGVQGHGGADRAGRAEPSCRVETCRRPVAVEPRDRPMDLHFTADEPDPEETAGRRCLPRRAWLRRAATRAAVPLLPVLHAIRTRWAGSARARSTTPARGWRCRPPRRSAWPTSTLCFQTRPHPPVAVHVCDDIACRTRGAEALCAEVEAMLGPARATSRDGHATWHRSPCLGLCERAPAALVVAAGEPRRATRPGSRRRRRHPAPPWRARRCRTAGPRGLRAAAGAARPEAARAASAGSTPRASTTTAPPAASTPCAAPSRWAPAAVVREVIEAKLVGRGGAAFPTGRKWQGGALGGAAALPGLQRRRVRARHLQGPRADGGRSVRADRGDDHRRLRHRLRAGLSLHPRRVSAGRRRGSRTPSSAAATAASSATTSWATACASTSSCGAAPAPTSAARRRR